MLAIIDYGVGNLFSLQSAVNYLNVDAKLTKDISEIKNASHIILPGVGAFKDAAQKLFNSGLVPVIKEAAQNGTPILGICLGMQLLFDESHEYGVHKGLGLIEGTVLPLDKSIENQNLKIPHMGWNALDIQQNDDIFKYINPQDYVYFVHSFYAKASQNYILATSEYGFNVTAVVKNKNVYGMQFHPEKSGETGIALLKAFCEMGDK